MKKLKIVRYRRYNHNHKLIGWIQRRCIKCKRFLSKDEKYYCKECFKLWRKEYSHKPENRFYSATKQFVYKHINDLNIGDILENLVKSKSECGRIGGSK